MEIVYLNGNYLPIQEAKISVCDRGFLFGDGVYEVITIYQGQPFHLCDHFQRLQQSLEKIYMACPLELDQLQSIIARLLGQYPRQTPMQSVYIEITRGEMAQRAHHFSGDISPTVYVRVTEVKPRDLSNGVAVITMQDIRWHRADIKSINRLANVMMSQQVQQAGVEEAIVLQGNHVLEGVTSNVFLVHNACLLTPPLGEDLLGGITRKIVLDLATTMMNCEQRPITLPELYGADEVFITSSTRGIAPVVRIDSNDISRARPGEWTQRLIRRYQGLHKALSHD